MSTASGDAPSLATSSRSEDLPTFKPNYGLPYDWIPVGELPSPGERPGRVFVLVEGRKEHSGLRWRRQEVGIAATWNEGFDPKHIAFIERLGDMDKGSGEVTHWLPIDLPPFPGYGSVP